MRAKRDKPVQLGLLLDAPPPDTGGITVGWEINEVADMAAALGMRSTAKGLNFAQEADLLASLGREVAADLAGPNGEPFIYATDGSLIGGRKVALAAVNAGRRILRLTVRNVDPKAQFVLGDYVPRSRRAATGPVPPPTPDGSLELRLAHLVSGAPDAPRASLVLLTPAMARTLMPDAREYERLKATTVVRLMARDIKASGDGRSLFVTTGESIKVDRFGRVMDGRKRLAAVILSKTPIRVVLVKNLDPAWAGTYDRGRPMTPGARFNVENVSSPWDVASTIQMYDWLFLTRSEARLGFSLARLREVFDANRWLTDSTRDARPCEDFVTQKVNIVLHRAFSRQDPERAAGFFREIELAVARNRKPGDNAEWVNRLRHLVDRAMGARVPIEVRNLRVMNHVIQAWEGYIAGTPPAFETSSRKPLLDLG